MLSALFLNKNTIEECSKENKKNRNLDKNALRKICIALKSLNTVVVFLLRIILLLTA